MISNPFQAAMNAAVHDDIATRRSELVDPRKLIGELHDSKDPVAASGPAGPVAAPAPLAADPSNRRVAPRAGLAVEVTLKSEHNFYAGFSENLSEGGLFVATDALQPVGSIIQIAFTLPKVKQTIEVLAEVRWVRPASATSEDIPAGMGLQFKGLDWDTEDLISEFVKARQPIFYVD